MKKKQNNNAYKILRPIIMCLFKLYFNPKAVNRIVLPEGPILLCANHINAHDQFMGLLSTKRIVHYMAKKEYFDGKAASFFRAAGCIPVDRSTKDETAKSEALEILENGGAIGIFPEGTRNTLVDKKEKLNETYSHFKEDMSFKKFKNKMKKLKTRTSQIDILNDLKNDNEITYNEYKKIILDINNEMKKLVDKGVIFEHEYNSSFLLPFKYGAVSLAQKTSATIIPFATNGNYKFRSRNLKVKFGEPFKVGDMDLTKANDKLFKIIDNLILDLKEDEANEKGKSK